MMSSDTMKVELEVMQDTCCICGLAGELATPEEYDAASGSAAPLRTALLQLNNNKVVPEGRLCGSCAQRAIDAHDFSSSLAARTAAPLSDKIRALRKRLHELTQKIDVFIVVGGPGASGTYSEDDIIMVERGALPTDDRPPLTNTKGDHVYQCSVCPQSFSSMELYRAHSATHPPDSLHSCWSCGQQFTSEGELKAHQIQHQVDDTTCHLCHATYKSSVQLRAHTSVGVCAPCPLCGYEAVSRAALSSHAADHPDLCPVCFVVLADQEAMAGHALLHRSSRRFVCAVGDCVLRFTKREHLLTHLRTHHSEEEPKEETSVSEFGCEVCGRSFASQAALKRHARVHRDVEQARVQPEEYANATEGLEQIVEYEWQEGVEGEDVEYLEIETLDEEIVG